MVKFVPLRSFDHLDWGSFYLLKELPTIYLEQKNIFKDNLHFFPFNLKLLPMESDRIQKNSHGYSWKTQA